MIDEPERVDGALDSDQHNDVDFMNAIDEKMKGLGQKAPRGQTSEPLALNTEISPDSQKITVKTRNMVKPEDATSREEQSDNSKTVEGAYYSSKIVRPTSGSSQQTEQVAVKTTSPSDFLLPTEPAPTTSRKKINTDHISSVSGEKKVLLKTSTNREPKEESAAPQAQADDSKLTQVINVQDINKYHLPLKPTSHHRKHTVHPLTAGLIISLIVVVILLAAIDMELLNLGFELPFDVF